MSTVHRDAEILRIQETSKELKQRNERIQKLTASLKKHKMAITKIRGQAKAIKVQNAKLTQNLNEKDRQFTNLKRKYNEMARKLRKRNRSPSMRTCAGSFGSMHSRSPIRSPYSGNSPKRRKRNSKRRNNLDLSAMASVNGYGHRSRQRMPITVAPSHSNSARPLLPVLQYD